MKTSHLIMVLGVTACISASDSAAQDPPPLWEEVFLNNIEPLQYGAGAWGDYDGDGDFDLVYTGSKTDFDDPTPFTQFYINLGEAVRTTPDPEGGGEPIEVFGIDYSESRFNDIFVTPLWRSSAAWGDVNGDGLLDILISGSTGSEERLLQIYYQLPEGASRPFVLAFEEPGLSDGDLEVADIDNDGDQDIVLSGYDDNDDPQTMIYENLLSSGSGFALMSTNLISVGQSSLAIGDYDNDQDLDLIITGVGNPQEFITLLYNNDGQGNFAVTSNIFKPLLGATLDWGDYDADGDLDIIYSGGVLTPFLLEGEVYVYENIGGLFNPDGVTILKGFGGVPAFGRYHGSARWGDYNNDGFLDFLLAGSRGPQQPEAGQVFENQQSNTFTYSTIGRHGRFSGGLFGTSFWGDYDDDGDLDIFSMGYDESGGNISKGFRNYLPWYPRNQVPQAPTQTSSAVNGSQVTLSWDAGRDSRTPTQGLTYNVRIGTSEGANDIMSAMARVDNGSRYIAANGNVQNNLTWTISNLPSGTYFWAVQTIDTSFKGSPFTAEASFIIP